MLLEPTDACVRARPLGSVTRLVVRVNEIRKGVFDLRSSLRVPIATALALVLALSFAIPAFASPLSDKQAQAAALQAQIDALDTKVSIADEAYNVARDKNTKLTAEVHAAESKAARLQAQDDALQASLSARVDQMYRDDGSTGVIEALLSTRTLADFGVVLQALTDIAGRDAATMELLVKTEAELKVTRQNLAVAQSESAVQEAAMASNLKVVQQQLASRASALAATSADIRQLLADAQAAADAAARARYVAYVARQRAAEAAAAASAGNSSGGSSAAPGSGSDQGGSARGAAAVRWAETALGRPYQWAASGPGSFDCSGLMMWAYGHVGVSLPHSSRSQIGSGSRVARSDLQPGDLVFFGSPIHHVGMYVGDGDFIEAPHTGAVVRIASLSGRGDYAGASRP